MIYLVDTNVLSEWMKPDTDPAVSAWLESADWLIPVPVLAEIQEGAEAVRSTARRESLKRKISRMADAFADVFVDWDSETALLWGTLRHSPEVRRKPQALWDSLIDAMAVRLDATVATRNEKDFRHARTFNPWTFTNH